jgi:protein gp37
MGKETSISWTDATFNPWHGCTKVSPGCDNCYAETFDKRVGGEHWGKGQPRRTFKDLHWNEPLNWDKIAGREGKKLKVFCASMADVMDDEAPEGARERLWELIDATPNLIWQLLTKRPQRYLRHIPRDGFKHKNVWLGTSAENQELYNLRWPFLRLAALEIDAIAFISYEPALGPVSMDPWASRFQLKPTPPQKNIFTPDPPRQPTKRLFPDWMIFGGESGPHRRPMEQVWAESMKKECEMWEVAFFMKQVSARTPGDGASLIPAQLLIRQFPGDAL